MALQVCTGATLHCSYGTESAVFNATPRPVTTSGRVVGVLTDHRPMLNVPAFGDCQPATASASTTGPLASRACMPSLPDSWSRAVPASAAVLVSGTQVLDDSCTLACVRGGTIRIGMAGQAGHRLG